MTRTRPRRQLVICGLGGQGILFLARVLAEAAMLDGDEVLTAETHGMAQRGGAVEAHLKLGGFASSLVRRGSADAVLVLDASRLEPARATLAAGGVCVANTPEPAEGIHALDAAAEARALEHPRGQNLILLGFAAATAPDHFPAFDSLRTALERRSPTPWREANVAALERGRRRAGTTRPTTG